MSLTLPKTLVGQDRSSFTLIDPSTQLYHRKFDRHGWLNNSTRQHVAISYVWSEWTDGGSNGQPNWDALRERLVCILGAGSSKSLRAETGDATRCWLDCKCIDQKSASSKTYWIPRMDEIYAEAKCTVLLLKDPSISILLSISQRLKCNIKSEARLLDWPHSCLLSQSCTELPGITDEQERECVGAMRNLYNGKWRKRAWIFQEILLSTRYLLSIRGSDYIELEDVGRIANLLFHRHAEEQWLGDFSDWCRQLFYLRHFYSQAVFHHLSDANVLQMAMGLEATFPADKIYALCGILKLKHITYDNKQTAEEAFQVVVGELSRLGRLSWLYAISPSLGSETLQLDEGHITPFVLTRLSDRLVTNRNKAHFSNDSVGLSVMSIGEIVQTKPLAQVLREAHKWIKEHDCLEFPPNLEYLFFTPKIIRRVALDVVNPLLIEPLFGRICDGLGIAKDSATRPSRVWRMILLLYMKDVTSQPVDTSIETQEDRLSTRLAWSAARSLQERLKWLENDFSITWWHSEGSDSSESLGLGSHACAVGNHVCSIKDDEQLLIAADFQYPITGTSNENEEKLHSVDARFRGAIYDLNSTLTIQWRVKVFVVHLKFAPLDMQGPILGDHPFWDGFRDDRYDKYIMTPRLRSRDVLSLFGKVRNQPGMPLHLNLPYRSTNVMDRAKENWTWTSSFTENFEYKDIKDRRYTGV